MRVRPSRFLGFSLFALAGCVSSGRPWGPTTPGRLAWIEQRTAAVRGIERPSSAPAPSESWRAFAVAAQATYSEAALAARARADRALGFPDPPAGAAPTAVVGGFGTAAVWDAQAKRYRVLPDLETGRPGEAAYVHEYTHFLDDTKFALWRMRAAESGDSDRAIALTALIEGDAVVTQVDYKLADGYDGVTSGAGGSQVSRTAADFENDLGLYARVPDRKALAALLDAPPWVRERIIFPYAEGARFARALRERRGTASMDDAFARPPLSTEQVLHPGKYADRRDDPVRVELGADARLGDPVFEDTLGELGIRQLLSLRLPKDDAVRAAEGWGGDRYRVARTDAGDALYWHSVWDTERDAEEFAQALDAAVAARYGATPCWMLQFGFDHVARPDGRTAQIRKVGKSVVLVDPAPDARLEWTDAVLASSRVTEPARNGRLEEPAWKSALSPFYAARAHDDGSSVRVLGGMLASSDRHGDASSFHLFGGALLDVTKNRDGGRVSLLFGLISWSTAPRLEGKSVRVGPFAYGKDSDSVSWSAIPLIDAPAYSHAPGHERVRLGLVNFDSSYRVEYGADGAAKEKEQVKGGTSLVLGLLGREWTDWPESDGTPYRRNYWYFPTEIGFSVDHYEYGPLGPDHKPRPAEASASRPAPALLPGDVVAGTQIQALARMLFGLDSQTAYRGGEVLNHESTWALLGGMLGSARAVRDDYFWATPLFGWREVRGRRELLLLWGIIPIPVGGGDADEAPAAGSEPAAGAATKEATDK